MGRIAIFNLGAHGHVNPTLTMTQELVARGHDISYFCTEEFRNPITRSGAKFFPYDSNFSRHTPKVEDLAQLMATFPVRLFGEAAHVFPQVMETTSVLKPELVMYDPMCVTGRLVAEVLKLPAVTLHPTYAASAAFSLRESANHGAPSPEVVREYEALTLAVSKQFSIKPTPLSTLYNHAEGLNLVFMPRSFHPASETFDRSFQFVGPGFTERPDTGHWQPSAVPREHRLFISMGTVFNDWPEFFKMSLEAFADTDWEVLMAVGKRVDLKRLGAVPKNFTLAEYLPQLDILPHTSVAIMHGGMGTTMEALSNGVPLVVIPQMHEQRMTASRVAELGLGCHLNRQEVTPSVLVAAVKQVAHDRKIREAVKTFQQQLENHSGYIQAVRSIEAYMRSLD